MNTIHFETLKKIVYGVAVILAVLLSLVNMSWAQSDGSEFAAQTAWGRDPFTAAELDMITIDTAIKDNVEEEPEPRRDYSLTGILTRGASRVAIVDRVLVREGDKIDDAEVKQIEPESVVIKEEDEEIVLKLR